MTHTITKEFQETIAEKIESAFVYGQGHYFMQKNNFSEIIAVSEFFIEEYEMKGYEFFILNNYNRNNKPVIIDEPVKNKIVKSNCIADGFYDEFPDAYNQIL